MNGSSWALSDACRDPKLFTIADGSLSGRECLKLPYNRRGKRLLIEWMTFVTDRTAPTVPLD